MAIAFENMRVAATASSTMLEKAGDEIMRMHYEAMAVQDMERAVRFLTLSVREVAELHDDYYSTSARDSQCHSEDTEELLNDLKSVLIGSVHKALGYIDRIKNQGYTFSGEAQFREQTEIALAWERIEKNMPSIDTLRKWAEETPRQAIDHWASEDSDPFEPAEAQ
jgi:hypothetical protein